MQLNKLIIETRVRSAWSAIDLGLAIGKLFWLRGVLLYLIVAAPVFMLTRFVSDVNSLLPYFILWWCKPVFERPILFFLSRELFNEPMSLVSTLKQVKSWLLPGLGWILSIRRLSLVRSMNAPITLLERPNNAQYRQRASVLGNKSSSQAAWLNIVLFHLESFLSIALLVLLAIFFPKYLTLSFDWINKLEDISLLVDLASITIVAVIAPFYTAAGFMLYISRRVELEGWDIEICFRDWMAKEHGTNTQELASEADNA